MKKILLACTSLVLLATACKKDDNSTPNAQTKFVSRIIYDDGPSGKDTVDIKYNSSNAIIGEVWHAFPNFDTYAPAYNLSNSKNLDGISSGYKADLSGMTPYRVFHNDNSGKVITINRANDGVNYDSIAYDNSGNINKLYNCKLVSNVKTILGVNSYTWNNNNLTEVRYAKDEASLANNFIEKYAYTYDNKTSPLYGMLPSIYLLYSDLGETFGSKNNPITVSRVGASSASNFNATIVYTYDASGYPVSGTASRINNGVTTSEAITFQYK